MVTIRIVTGNPDTLVLHERHQTIVANGLTPREEAELRRLAADIKLEDLKTLVRNAHEATILWVQKDERTVLALRGWASNYELLWRSTSSELVVTDSWRNMIALLPMAVRALADTALVDHLLFGAASGAESYLLDVKRLGHGSCLYWRNGESKIHVFDRPEVEPSLSTDRDGCWGKVAHSLREVAQSYTALDGITNTLSGGVDSTLVHTYLGTRVPSVSAGIDSPEFAFETSYATDASRILGTSHHTYWIKEASYPDQLRETIRDAGLPPHLFQTALIAQVFKSEHRYYVTSQMADALFGLPRTRWAIRSHRIGSMTAVRWLLRSAPLLPRGIGDRFRTMRRRADQVNQPLVSGMGLGAHFMLYTDVADLSLAEAVFGPHAVRDRIISRADYVRARLPGEAANRADLLGHLQFGHLLDFLCDDSVSQWRQAAYAKAKQLRAPFVTRPIVDAALSVPVELRFVRRGRVKHVLKDILRSRLPEARVEAKKGGGDLPLERYLRSHPLGDAASICADVGLLSGRDVEKASAHPRLLWNLLSISLWKSEVLSDSAVRLHPSSADIRIHLDAGDDELSGRPALTAFDGRP